MENRRLIDIHNHTHFSNLRLIDAICTPETLIQRAQKIGLKGICITEHECLSESIEVCRLREKYPNIKLGIGNEIYLTHNRDKGQKYYHFILVAKDEIGHRQLRELSSRAWLSSYSDRGMERVPTLKSDLQKVVSKNKGHLIASSACLAGELSTNAVMMSKCEKVNDLESAKVYYNNINDFIRFCLDLFGDDFYIELPPGASQEQIIANRKLYRIAKAYNIKCEISCDSHYLKKEDRYIHKAFLNSRDGEREVDSFYEYAYLQDETDILEHLRASFGEDTERVYEECCAASEEIYGKIKEYDLRHPQTIPHVEVPDYPKKDVPELAKWKNLHSMYLSDDKSERCWVNECIDSLKKKEKEGKVPVDKEDDYFDELEKEADIKRTVGKRLGTNIFNYPLVLKHYIDLIWESGSIVGAGRGCFLPEKNKVLMADGRIKPIQDVKVGDYVRTIDGTNQRVLKTLNYDCNEEIYKITINGNTHQPLYNTNNHEYYAIKNSPCRKGDRKFCSGLNCKTQCSISKNLKKQWVRSDELSVGDFVLYPKIKFEKKNIFQIDLAHFCRKGDQYIINEKNIIGKYGHMKPVQRFIKVDSDFLYFIGVMIGDGWTTIDDSGRIGIAFNSSQKKDIESLNRCTKFLDNLGISNSVTKHKEKQLYQLQGYCRPFAVLIEELIGKGVEHKKIPDCLLYDNKEEMISLLEGLLASNGSYDKNALGFSYDGINYNLISQIKMLCSYLGIYAGVTTRPAHGNNKESYKLRAGGKQLNSFLNKLPLLYQHKAKSNQKFFVDEDGFWIQITKIEKQKYAGKVYDLTVNNNHNYIVNNIVVHNSAGAGLNHWLLGITQADPLPLHLPFERYMNWDTQGLPDIDFDLCPSKRPLIIQKVKEERGKNFRPDIDDLSRENLGCTLIATFGTASSKRAIQIAAKGYRSEDYPNGIDIDESNYISSLIGQERGFVWNIKDSYYGNKEKGREPNKAFKEEVDKYPGLLDIIMGVEGLIVSRSSHASGIILFDEDPYEFSCFMRTPNGDVITQYDLEDCESAGMTKYDWLLTSISDKIVETIKLLQEDKKIDPNLKLREVYDKYLSPDALDFTDGKVWDAINGGHILSLFQFDSDVGRQGIQKVQPRTLDDLSNTNGIIRLMGKEGEERPLDKFVRYKNNIGLWYKEMQDAGLTEHEQHIMEKYLKKSYGIGISQECIMWSLMDPEICGFNLAESNKARKIISKKRMDQIPALHDKVMSRAKTPEIGAYEWKYVISPSLGYGFSDIHSIFYSMIGFQSAYLATHWNPIYWNTACLIVDSGSLETGANDNTDYKKLATALGKIRKAGIKISLVDINKSGYGFKPDVENNQILYGMKAMLNVGDDVIEATIKNRPYVSPKDYLMRVKPKKQTMISLIKGGAFDNMMDRKTCMAWYIWETCDKKKRLTLQNMRGLIKYNLLPETNDQEKSARRIFEFNRYLKAVCKDKDDKVYYHLDDRAINFLTEMHYDDLILTDNGSYTMGIKPWDNKYQKWMDIFRKWIADNKESILQKLNDKIFMDDWNKYAKGTISAWEMESLCFYYHEHELAHIDNRKYGLVDFYKLSPNPVVDKTFEKGGRKINIFKLYKICGTCIAKDKTKSTVSLLTTSGVVTVKFRKEYFSLFDKQISERQADGTKKIKERSWFNRGSMIIVMGIRSGDDFITKKYKSSVGHQLYKIDQVNDDGTLTLRSERYQGNIEEDNE